MKILLIYPPFLEQRLNTEDVGAVPMGLYYVAAMARAHGWDVEIVNWHDVHTRPGEISRTLEDRRPDVIGFSVLHANRWGALDIAATARRLLPGVRIVFGGIGATCLWEHFLTHFPQVDVIVLGEGEHTFVQLVRCFEKSRGRGLADIPGIAFRRRGAPHRTAPADNVADLDELPPPSKWFTFSHIALTRGCPAGCRFCGSPAFWGRRVRFHSTDYFVGQIRRLYRRGVRFFFVSDDTFTLNKRRVTDICRRLVDLGLDISWAAVSRVDTVDEPVLRWMRRAGCIQISFGVESGSEEIRARLAKSITTADIRRAFALTRRCGIMPRAYFIYGSPGETAQTIAESVDLMAAIKPLSAIFYILDLFPGTALYEDFKRRTGASDDIWLQRVEDILYFETDPALSRAQVLSYGKTLRSAFYRGLPDFVRSVDLTDEASLFPLHADFLSRLGLTFDQGDYARVEAIAGKEELAAELYRRALDYHPDARAFLGLGILHQKDRDHAAAVKILRRGLVHFPGHQQLNVCLGISLLNLGEVRAALDCFLPFDASAQALHLAARCFEALGKPAKARRYDELARRQR
jgi:radical SAM superfamily enzyme YgiQ (UPF0313 family)